MKLRTDFVTNSGSSSFTVQIVIDTVEDDAIECSLVSGGEEFYGELSVTNSPADPGKCASIKDLTEMFRMCVKADGNNAADDDDYLSELI